MQTEIAVPARIERREPGDLAGATVISRSLSGVREAFRYRERCAATIRESMVDGITSEP